MHIIILRTCVCERACVKMREQAPGKRTEGSGSEGGAERSEPRAEARQSRAERTEGGSKAEPSGANRGRKSAGADEKKQKFWK